MVSNRNINKQLSFLSIELPFRHREIHLIHLKTIHINDSLKRITLINQTISVEFQQFHSQRKPCGCSDVFDEFVEFEMF